MRNNSLQEIADSNIRFQSLHSFYISYSIQITYRHGTVVDTVLNFQYPPVENRLRVRITDWKARCNQMGCKSRFQQATSTSICLKRVAEGGKIGSERK